MSTGIAAIGTAVGSVIINNIDRAEQFERDVDFIKNKIGFHSLRRLGENQTILDLCLEALADLKNKEKIDLACVDCLIVITQNPAQKGLPHTSAILHGLIGLGQDVAAFDISLGCSGYIYGLSIALSFMQANGLRCGLLFTADPYSDVLDKKDVSTELLFGDAATCSLLTSPATYRIGKTVMGTDGTKWEALKIDATSKFLYMNGRNIFNFSMTVVPDQVQKVLLLNKLQSEDVDYFIFHQASRFIVENLEKRLDLPHEKVPFGLEDIGNCVSSTIPFMLSRIWENQPQKILLSGFGVGLSWASTLLFNTRNDR